MEGQPAGAGGEPRARLTRVLDDERGFLAAMLLRMVLVFALLAVVVNDAGQVIIASTRAGRGATAAAQVGAETFASTRNAMAAEQAARNAVQEVDERVRVASFLLSRDGSATVTAQITARTMLLGRVPLLSEFARQEATETRRPR